jgi:YD repeat-containing protein
LTSLSVPGGTNTITYDDRGLPLTITGPADGTAYTYTNDGRMASRTDAAGTTSFTYDTAGRFKTASNTAANIDLTVNYNTMSLPSTVFYGSNNQTRTLTYDDLHRLKNIRRPFTPTNYSIWSTRSTSRAARPEPRRTSRN